MLNTLRQSIFFLGIFTTLWIIPNECRAGDYTPEQSFTGQVIGSKVRMRLQPELDSSILRQLDKNEYLIVKGEKEDFYAIEPPRDQKGYVFRTFILDGVVEGNRVNVRLSPDLDAPILAQLNTGDRVEGVICEANPKWFEISPPKSVSFYVYKDYIKKVGDKQWYVNRLKRQDEVNRLLNAATLASQTEIQKPFEEINLEPLFATFNRIVNEYPEFTENVEKSKELMGLIQANYLQKKVVYLEGHASTGSQLQEKNAVLHAAIREQEKQLHELELRLAQEIQRTSNEFISNDYSPSPSPWVWTRQSHASDSSSNKWENIEQSLYSQWSLENNDLSLEDFYRKQINSSASIKGIIEPYQAAIKNKPGDFVLLDKNTRLPICYLYSTRIDLREYIGNSVTILGSPRPNNHFAFPAYIVLAVD